MYGICYADSVISQKTQMKVHQEATLGVLLLLMPKIIPISRARNRAKTWLRRRNLSNHVAPTAHLVERTIIVAMGVILDLVTGETPFHVPCPPAQPFKYLLLPIVLSRITSILTTFTHPSYNIHLSHSTLTIKQYIYI